MYTLATKPQDFKKTYTRKWWVMDVSGISLGRAASYIASIIRGKHQTFFSPHVDCGDYVVVVNAAKVKLTGNKVDDKMYYRHTGFPGGLKSETAKFKLSKKPEDIIYQAVKRMMPRSPLNRRSLHKLKIYADDQHPHMANKPEKLDMPRITYYTKNQ